MPFLAKFVRKPRFFKRAAGLFLALSVCALLLSACGKRPSQVEPPPGGAATAKVYPAPEVEP